jgi:hypothetical protein
MGAAASAGAVATERLRVKIEKKARKDARAARRNDQAKEAERVAQATAQVAAEMASDHVEHGLALWRRGEALDANQWHDRYGRDLHASKMQAAGALALPRGWHTEEVWLLPGGVVQKRFGARTDGRRDRFDREAAILARLADCEFVPRLLLADRTNLTLYTTYCGAPCHESRDRRAAVRDMLAQLERNFGVFRSDNVGKKFPGVPDSNILRDPVRGLHYLVGFGGPEWRTKPAPATAAPGPGRGPAVTSTSPARPASAAAGVIERTWLSIVGNESSTQRPDPNDPARLVKMPAGRAAPAHPGPPPGGPPAAPWLPPVPAAPGRPKAPSAPRLAPAPSQRGPSHSPSPSPSPSPAFPAALAAARLLLPSSRAPDSGGHPPATALPGESSGSPPPAAAAAAARSL